MPAIGSAAVTAAVDWSTGGNPLNAGSSKAHHATKKRPGPPQSGAGGPTHRPAQPPVAVEKVPDEYGKAKGFIGGGAVMFGGGDSGSDDDGKCCGRGWVAAGW